ncbi:MULTISPECIES: type II secretion system protein [Campylobacter]|uniref:type II secretion system protein n=1 Tax=Campylobacter TaxID=194 RepID=UPI00027A3669|nr:MULTISPECIES: type II secretion system protein [Campylobacter]EJP75571.1 prepilin-type cleavage/methylation N-terminal domain protein [Campylobacter sp. FOBRC14]
MVKRRGFSLIELILSIVIVAIVSLSLPLVMKLTSQTNAKAMTQESIMNAKTYMSLILKAPFSKETVKTSNGALSPRVYEGGDIDEPTFYEKFGLNGDGRRIFYNLTTRGNIDKPPTTGNNEEYISKKSIDDFATKELTINYDKDKGIKLKRDYVVKSQYSVKVNDGSNTFKGASNNDIKEVVIQAISYGESQGIKTDVTIRGFVANIGDSGFLITKVWR